MPHFCMAVNLRAVWRHSCVTLTRPSNPIWLFIHAHQAPGQAPAQCLWPAALLHRPSNNSARQGSVHHLLAKSYHAMVSNAKLLVCACCRCCWLRQGCSQPLQGWRAQRCALVYVPAAWLLFQALCPLCSWLHPTGLDLLHPRHRTATCCCMPCLASAARHHAVLSLWPGIQTVTNTREHDTCGCRPAGRGPPAPPAPAVAAPCRQGRPGSRWPRRGAVPAARVSKRLATSAVSVTRWSRLC